MVKIPYQKFPVFVLRGFEFFYRRFSSKAFCTEKFLVDVAIYIKTHDEGSSLFVLDALICRQKFANRKDGECPEAVHFKALEAHKRIGFLH